MSDRTAIISSPFKDRDDAHAEERVLQAFLDGVWAGGPLPEDVDELNCEGYTLPAWAHGVRVESAPNGKQHTLVATEHRGH